MRASPIWLLVAVLLASPAPASGAAPRKGTKAAAASRAVSSAAAKRTPKAQARTSKAKRPPQRAKKAAPKLTALEKARAQLRAVKADPHRRKYKHEWEKAIRAIERAAVGKSRAPALLEAARARYALYRFSSDESDRDAALALARKAEKAGARDARAFAAAVRREAGDDERPAVATRPKASSKPQRPAIAQGPSTAASPSAAPAPRAAQVPAPEPELLADGPDQPPETDPVLDRILAQLAEDPEGSADAAEPADAGPAAPPSDAERPAHAATAQAPDDELERIIAEQVLAPPPPSDPQEGPADVEGDRGPVRRIIVDAGHGGHDTGAIGPTRLREKDVVLAVAKKLAKRLRAQGYEVVLTRDRDVYLKLAERAAIANRARGDLFVSIHANAHPRRDRQGVETYVLNVNGDRYAARLAARENGVLDDDGAAFDVRRILADLDAKVSAESSRRLARLVQAELTEGIRSRVGPVRDLGVKSALFYVLLGARMPAVLVETSFISNRAEEKRLRSPAFQDELAAGIARAVHGYAAQEQRVASLPRAGGSQRAAAAR